MHRKLIPAVAVLISCALFSCPGSARAQGETLWADNGAAVSAIAADQLYAQGISDGAGGAILAWQDTRGGDSDIYAQRLDTNGNALWTNDGVPICAAAGMQSAAQLADDGAGGAIITWQDARSGTYDIYAQRIDGDGDTLWADNGVGICVIGGKQQWFPQIAPDGSGGAIIAWQDNRIGTFDIAAQRVDADGAAQWLPGGIPICWQPNAQTYPRLIPDGDGGAVIAWQDARGGGTDIYASKVDAAGNQDVWLLNGVAVCDAAGDQSNVRLIGDGSGGAILTWQDARGADSDIYAQALGADGNSQWAVDGLPVCFEADAQSMPRLAADGAGGAIITWQDLRSGDYDVYAQSVDAAGNLQWAGGVQVCVAAEGQGYPTVASDGAGGAIVSWTDARSGEFDIYAQALDAGGAALWGDDGTALCAEGGVQFITQTVADGDGGAIIAWTDFRDGSSDIYAQRARTVPGGPGAGSNYINLDLDAGGGELVLDWACDFGSWDYQGAPLRVYLALIRNPAVEDGPSSTADALSGEAVYLYTNRMGDSYLYDGSVREPTWNGVSFPPVAFAGTLRTALPEEPGDYVFAVAFIRSDTGAFVRPDGQPVENSNKFVIH